MGRLCPEAAPGLWLLTLTSPPSLISPVGPWQPPMFPPEGALHPGKEVAARRESAQECDPGRGLHLSGGVSAWGARGGHGEHPGCSRLHPHPGGGEWQWTLRPSGHEGCWDQYLNAGSPWAEGTGWDAAEPAWPSWLGKGCAQVPRRVSVCTPAHPCVCPPQGTALLGR